MAQANTVSIWIPCESFDVILTSDDAGPTDLERAVLLFLAQGEDVRLEEVVDFLSVGERLAMDLVTGLWNLGYILVDVSTGAVRLDPYWLQKVKAREWSSIQAARPLSETVPLMRELASGQILAARTAPRAPRPDRAAPVLVSASLAQSLTRSELATIALRTLPTKSPLRASALKLRADSAQLARTSVNATDWLRLEFEALVDSEVEDSLSLRLLPSDEAMQAGVGPRIADALCAWALDNKQHPLVVALKSEARRELRRRRPSLAARIDGLVANLDLGIAAPLDHQGFLRTWPQTLAELTSEVEALEGAQGRVVLHTGVGGARGFLQLAAAFEHQAVIAAPSVDYQGLQAFNDVVLAVLKDRPLDSSVVLLWGGARQQRLSGQCVDALKNAGSETQTAEGARLFSPDRSARIATALAVIDGRRVLYASASPLEDRSTRAAFSFILDIAADPPSPIPRSVLEIARERASSFVVSERIDLSPWSREKSSGEQLAQLAGPSTDVDTQDVWEGDEASRGLALKAYFHDLRAAAFALGQRTAEAGPTAQILSDGSLYQQALDILADSDSISVETTLWIGFGRDEQAQGGLPLHRALAEAVAERARMGLATVVLAEPSVRDGGIDIGTLRALAKARPDKVTVLDTPGLEGHFVCGEERFLAAPGGMASPPVVQTARLASRVIGILAADQALCVDFRAALAKAWPALENHLGVAAPRDRRRTRAPITSIAALVTAWRAGGVGGRRAALARALGTDPIAVDAGADILLTLTPETVDPTDLALRGDALALLAAHGSPGRRPEALAELARMAWRGGRWQEAALILEAGESQGVATLADLPLDLAVAAAVADLGLPAGSSLSSFLERPDLDGWMAGVALAANAVLFHGDPIAEWLEVKLADAPPPEAAPLHAIAAAARTYWSATAQTVDGQAIAAMNNREEADAGLTALALAFADSFRLAAHHHSMMKRVLPLLYNEVSGLRPVAEMIAETGAITNREAVLAGLFKVFGGGRVNIVALSDDFFEQARRRSGVPNETEIFRGKGKGRGVHETFQGVLRRAVDLRDALVVAREGASRRVGDDMQALLAALRTHLPGLAEMVRAQPADSLSRPLLAAFHSNLAQLLSGAT